MGTDPVSFGSASLGGGGTFQVTGNTCDGKTLAYGETCAISVAANPVGAGVQAAELLLPDNTTAGHRRVGLTVTGVDGRAVSTSPGSLDFGSQVVGTTGGT